MATQVYIDGTIHEGEDAKVPVFDRGFLYGDSVYEVTRTFGGKPFALEEHLARLEKSAHGIGMEPPPRDLIRQAVLDTVRAAQNAESYIRVIVTRGAGEIGLDPGLADRPRLVVIVRPTTGPDRKLVDDGVEVAIVSVRRNLPSAIDPNVKSGNYLNSVLAMREARRRGGYEAVMCDAEGRLAECSSSNLFVLRGEKVCTPGLAVGILDGITRRKVLELCQANGIAALETELRPDDLRGAEEAFLTSSVRGVLPVVRVDGQPLSGGRPGPVTRRIMALYDQLTRGS
ncbi:MAG TPA: aminotransferase class IV [Polyangia bacterium]|nr:aminotransferase class IV [Polyangia bacterium]